MTLPIDPGARAILTAVVTIVFFGSGFGGFAATAWLGGNIEWLRARGFGASLPLPGERYGTMGWIWTAQHRAIANRPTTRAVMLARWFLVLFVMSVAAAVALNASR